jgi:L-glyceraldehyde 3-phosphate reductase
VLVGVSRKEQLLDNLDALKKIHFDETELKEIDGIFSE